MEAAAALTEIWLRNGVPAPTIDPADPCMPVAVAQL